MQDLKPLAEKIKSAKTALVVAHLNPDGDTLGSMLALSQVLEQAGLRTVHRLMHDEVPEIYQFFPGQEQVLCSQKEEDLNELLDEYDLSFSCDCGSVQRLGSAGLIWQQRAKTTVNVDHHLSNPLYADINIVDPDATSTGQVVNYLARELGTKIDKDLASLLYITLLTDTGGFRHSNTNQNVFDWASELVALGAEPHYLYNKLFNQIPFRAMRVIGDALNKLEIIELETKSQKLRIAFTDTRNDTLTQLNAKDEDTDEIVDHIMRIKGIDMCLYLRQGRKAGIYKGSLRSACDIDCSAIAEQFNGGGHARAAGFNLSGELNEIKAQVLEQISK